MRSTPSRSGFALGGTLAIGAFIAVAAGSAIIYSANALRQSKYDRIGRARDRIAERLSYAARQPANLNQSALMGGASPTNAANNFNLCAINGNGNCPGVGAWTEFDLFDAGGVRMAGTQANPIRYNMDEQICPGPAGVNCPFEGIALFRAFCAGGPCDAADTIEVQTLVRMAPNVLLPLPGDTGGKGVRVSERLNMSETQRQNVNAANMSETQRVAGREVAGRGRKACIPPEIFKGTDRNGRIICVAPPGITDCQPAGDPSKANSFIADVNFAATSGGCGQITLPPACGADQYFRGYDATGAAVCDSIIPYVDERIVQNYTNYKQFQKCPAGLVAIGADSFGRPICEKLPLASGNISLLSPPPAPALVPPLSALRVVGPLPFIPRMATCSTNLRNQAHDVPFTVCICELVAIDGAAKTVTYRLTLGAGGGSLTGHACGGAYVIWGFPNEDGP